MTLIFTTPRCRIRPPVLTDRDAIRALHLDPVVRRHLGGPASPERAEALARDVVQGGGGGRRIVALLDTDASVGLLSLHPHHDGRDVEVSYLFAPARWGRGLATEALGACLDRALRELGLNRIVAETQEANRASRRVLEKVGMRPERRLVRFGAPQVLYATAPGP